jgi:hypothetical protein
MVNIFVQFTAINLFIFLSILHTCINMEVLCVRARVPVSSTLVIYSGYCVSAERGVGHDIPALPHSRPLSTSTCRNLSDTHVTIEALPGR